MISGAAFSFRDVPPVLDKGLFKVDRRSPDRFKMQLVQVVSLRHKSENMKSHQVFVPLKPKEMIRR